MQFESESEDPRASQGEGGRGADLKEPVLPLADLSCPFEGPLSL